PRNTVPSTIAFLFRLPSAAFLPRSLILVLPTFQEIDAHCQFASLISSLFRFFSCHYGPQHPSPLFHDCGISDLLIIGQYQLHGFSDKSAYPTQLCANFSATSVPSFSTILGAVGGISVACWIGSFSWLRTS